MPRIITIQDVTKGRSDRCKIAVEKLAACGDKWEQGIPLAQEDRHIMLSGDCREVADLLLWLTRRVAELDWDLMQATHCD